MECIHIFSVNKGFTRRHADQSLYVTIQTSDYIVIVFIYVDDLIF